MKTIESYAFYGCLSLIQMPIPSSVTYIGDQTFDKCPFTANDDPKIQLNNQEK